MLNDNIEILAINGKKRFVKKIFTRGKNKKCEIVYYVQERSQNDDKLEIWIDKYFNRSKKLVERRFLDL